MSSSAERLWAHLCRVSSRFLSFVAQRAEGNWITGRASKGLVDAFTWTIVVCDSMIPWLRQIAAHRDSGVLQSVKQDREVGIENVGNRIGREFVIQLRPWPPAFSDGMVRGSRGKWCISFFWATPFRRLRRCVPSSGTASRVEVCLSVVRFVASSARIEVRTWPGSRILVGIRQRR